MSLKTNKNVRDSTRLRNENKKPINQKNSIAIRKPLPESDESDSSDENHSDDDEDRWNDTRRAAGDLTPDYHSIQKLVKYVKSGNATATMVSLCCLKDYDLTIPINQLVRIEIT